MLRAKPSLEMREERLLPQDQAWKCVSRDCSRKTKLGSAGGGIAPAKPSLEVREEDCSRKTKLGNA
jgi:hypothetical protein